LPTRSTVAASAIVGGINLALVTRAQALRMLAMVVVAPRLIRRMVGAIA
jgi:uncharacterized membrane protein AbrB (regulator of aidB expression)